MLEQRISEEYLWEVPRTFRLIERILALGGDCSLERGRLPYATHLPKPGQNLATMFQCEQSRIGDFQPMLETLEQRLAKAGENQGAKLAAEAIQSRTTYLEWLSDPTHQMDKNAIRTLTRPSGEAEASWLALNRLYAHLTAAIEETLVHSVALQHAGRQAEAEQCWTDSFVYMLHAAEILYLFARQDWTTELDTPAVSGDLAEPTAQPSADATLAAAHRRHNSLAEAAASVLETTSKSGNSEFSNTPSATLTYAQERFQGRPGRAPRVAPPLNAVFDW
jgi:hypothetical protein